jgi:hypothetical protein
VVDVRGLMVEAGEKSGFLYGRAVDRQRLYACGFTELAGLFRNGLAQARPRRKLIRLGAPGAWAPRESTTPFACMDGSRPFRRKLRRSNQSGGSCRRLAEIVAAVETER